jgi:GTPase
MADPVVAIVGRPNVGKSTLFNRLIGNRIAIVEEEPNITRDRIYSRIEWLGNSFILVDTGGIEPYNRDIIKNKIKYQTEIAISEAELILFLVDGRSGITPTDREIARLLRRADKNVILVVNKIEDFNRVEELVWEFYALGFADPISISAEHGKNIGDLLDAIISNLPEKEQIKPTEDALNIAIIGKPNVGKSSLVNYIVGAERVIVSHIPGTTRDAVDITVERDGVKYNLIDTAGLRRKSRIKESIEYYGVVRTIKAIDRADAVLMLVDATEGITAQDKKILGYAHEGGKAIVIGINKWDLIEKNDQTMVKYRDEVYYQLKFLTYAPITFISALTGERVNEALELLKFSIDQNSIRIKTGLLNEVLEEAFQLREPPSNKGKRLKLFYATQTATNPPTFVFFVNNPELMHFTYQRYLENSLRKAFGFVGTSIRFSLKERH